MRIYTPEQIAQIKGAAYRHGHSAGGALSPTYNSWRAMIARCTNPNNNRFAEYGARGISVTPRWRMFAGFLADMGERPAGMSLDRVNNRGNYEPENCRWASPIEQRSNRRDSPQCKRGHDRATNSVFGMERGRMRRRCRICDAAAKRRWKESKC